MQVKRGNKVREKRQKGKKKILDDPRRRKDCDNSCLTSSGVSGELHVDVTSWRNVPLFANGLGRGGGKSVTTCFSGCFLRSTEKNKNTHFYFQMLSMYSRKIY